MAAKKLLVDQLTDGQCMENFLINTDKKGANRLTADMLRNRLTLLDKYWDSVFNRHKELCRLAVELEKEPYFEDDFYAAWEDVYIETKSTLQVRINDLVPSVALPQVGVSTNPVLPIANTSLWLPKLPLPRFSGNQIEWETFKERFSSMVKDVPNLAPVVKLQHLLACVEGEASRRLRSLQITNENFDVAWEALTKRYDNQRVRLSAHMRRILNMPSATRRLPGEINRLLDEVEEAIRAMRLLKRPVDQWDDWFIEIVVSRLDSTTREDWEKSLEGIEGFPKYQALTEFLENRARSLETANSGDNSRANLHNNNNNNNNKKLSLKPKSVSAHHTAAQQTTEKMRSSQKGCSSCNGKHFVSYCPNFAKLTTEQKRVFVERTRLCLNCLRAGHFAASCPSQGVCRIKDCGQRHNTLLHTEIADREIPQPNEEPPTPPGPQVYTMRVASESSPTSQKQDLIFLATAVVFLESPSGIRMQARALLDPCSEASFISERVAQALTLPKGKLQTPVSGVGGEVNVTSRFTTKVILRPRTKSNFSLYFPALLLGKLTALLPRNRCQSGLRDHFKGLELADPHFDKPASIDCILGADVYPTLILHGLHKGKPSVPVAQNTVLGWVITGPGSSSSSTTRTMQSFCTTTASPIDDLRKFWELEELPQNQSLSKDEQVCEDHFRRTHSRNQSGRYVVKLPFSRPPALGESLTIAERRLFSTERRLLLKPEVKQAYNKFMKEFVELQHMELVPKDEYDQDKAYYMPHHAVFKKDGSGKIRVVFNASQSTNNGLSLNDCLFSGPKLQTDIAVVLTRWRFTRFAFSADIIKMFRQFSMHKEDIDWLRILWRESPDEKVRRYRLLTVVYGTACAPFQAIRAVQQLAQDERQQFPKGASILEKNLYVDDALAGGHTLEDALDAQRQLVGILESAGMKLDKWSANDSALLPRNSSVIIVPRNLVESEIVSTLGLHWNPATDGFCFRVTLTPETRNVTKRTILSEVARLFDPLGWLSPITIIGKILIQRLWISGSDWDESVDPEILAAWRTLRDQLTALERVHVPRWLGTQANPTWYLHGFADASQRAYAATVYVVTRDHIGAIRSTLLIAKTKVAPIKTVSIPRLELCAALLLARLIDSIITQLQDTPAGTLCWSDSRVVLAWLNDHPSRWTTFVANRVGEILTIVPQARWQHVSSKENPADLGSRGTMPHELLENKLWWQGPDWLVSLWESWIYPQEICSTEEEKRTERLIFATQVAEKEKPVEALLSRFSTLSRLIRVIAYVFRWKINALQRVDRRKEGLSVDELSSSRRIVIRAVQMQHFGDDRSRLMAGQPVLQQSPLRHFLPFVDNEGIMRIGGRLQNAYLAQGEKHPIILPSRGHLAELLIRDAHLRTLHGGPQLVASYLLRAYWIMRSRNRIRQLTRQCARCVRFRGQLQLQQMAPLPSCRVTPARPFNTTGLDYAGPYMLRASKGRGIKAYKGYLAIFVCMVTRAVHIEVVSDYSSHTFLMAFRRFISRRGLCTTLYSDNGTTFQGASAELQRLFAPTSGISQEVASAVAAEGVNWRFIPPRAPHFGGIWEAGVKSAKHHLRRVIGDSKLTFEEMATLTTQIEACLNSRPLSPISSDPEDVAALTPGHFLVGTSLMALPDHHDSDSTVTGTSGYKMTLIMRNHFWKRWQKEVLQQQQRRAKWTEPNNSVQEGDLVIMTDDLLPPTKWPLARVIQCHPGGDGLVRVLTLKTATTTLQRPLVKVVRLPVESFHPATAATQLPPPGSFRAGGDANITSPNDPVAAGGNFIDDRNDT